MPLSCLPFCYFLGQKSIGNSFIIEEVLFKTILKKDFITRFKNEIPRFLRSQEKKTTKIDTSSDTSHEEIKEIIQLKEKNNFLKDTIRTQENQMQNLYHKLNYLQQKEYEHEKRIKAYDKLDRYVKRMSNNNNQVKTQW